jgi:hypothetical protein
MRNEWLEKQVAGYEEELIDIREVKDLSGELGKCRRFINSMK